jgi:hypothetical protein
MKLIILLIIALTIVSNASSLKVKLQKYLKEFKGTACGKNIPNKIDECGLEVMKIVNGSHIRLQCCAAWEAINCVEKKAKEKCEKEGLSLTIELLIKSDVGLLEANECIQYKKDSGKCNSGSSFKIDLFLMIFIILFNISFK